MLFAVALVLFVGLNSCIVCSYQPGGNKIVNFPLRNSATSLTGRLLVSRGGKEYYGFQGIKYANAPIRFQIGTLNFHWMDETNVTCFKPICKQFDPFKHKITGEEDCLYLNIYRPKNIGKNELLPVIVFIHGGAFEFGSGSQYGGKYLLDENVILVTLQYRLGAFGFLSTQDAVLQGNMGMKDQVLALEWIQHFIEYFQGDRNLVTLMGESAGAVSVDLHTLSPLSQGLFHRAVALSGSALCPWSLQKQSPKLASRLGKLLSCPSVNSTTLKECLLQKSAEQILLAQNRLYPYRSEFSILMFGFVPVIEDSEAPEPKFLTNAPSTLLHFGRISNPVPYMTGLTVNEGALFTALATKNPEALEEFNINSDEILPIIMRYEDLSESHKSAFSERIRDYYFQRQPLTSDRRDKYSNLVSDRMFNECFLKGARLHAKSHSTFSYLWNYTEPPRASIIQIIMQADYQGPTHGDELCYIFDVEICPKPESLKNNSHVRFSEFIIHLIKSFSIKGIPDSEGFNQPAWKKMCSKDTTIFEIAKSCRVVKIPFLNRVGFWETAQLVTKADQISILPSLDVSDD